MKTLPRDPKAKTWAMNVAMSAVFFCAFVVGCAASQRASAIRANEPGGVVAQPSRSLTLNRDSHRHRRPLQSPFVFPAQLQLRDFTALGFSGDGVGLFSSGSEKTMPLLWLWSRPSSQPATE